MAVTDISTVAEVYYRMHGGKGPWPPPPKPKPPRWRRAVTWLRSLRIQSPLYRDDE